MEQQCNAPIKNAFALLTDPKWLEARSLALGELSADLKAKKSGGAVTLTMKRRVKRELPGLLSKVLSPESELQFEEVWSTAQGDLRTGTLTMVALDQLVKMFASFELAPVAKGCVSHHAPVQVRCDADRRRG